MVLEDRKQAYTEGEIYDYGPLKDEAANNLPARHVYEKLDFKVVE